MQQTADDFRMGYMLDHEHTIKLLYIAAEKNISPHEVILELIDVNWALLERLRGNNDW